LFWQFRDGQTEFGVTLHRMSLQLDAGNIIGQSTATIPDGITIEQASSLLATAGNQLIARALADFEQATVDEVAQDEGIAKYHGFPLESDFAVSNLWTAKRLFNFVRATNEPGRIHPCTVGGRIYPLLKAIAYQDSGSAKMVTTSTTITIPCAQGSVLARFLPD
jgi:UDP-4-amino-4-deoxy-L-arabinose formyltransferase/UDP-glucuronic acid dehydrogenase (UDP-4-keto-hexauronic acid decarboxylating)